MFRFALLVGLVFLTACSGASDSISGLICGSGHAKGKMTVGMNFDFLKEAFGLQGFNAQSMEDDKFSDDSIKSYINGALEKGGVSESLFSVKSVESIKDSDSVRFLQTEGIFGEGFGVATGLLKKGFGLTDTGGAFDFINESFNVAAAAVAEGGHANQWAYTQTEYDKSVALYEKLKAKAGDKGKSTVTVAVLDTGVDLDHPDLEKILVEGYDALGTSTGSDDENGHGTHCAGIIAAQGKSADSPLGVATMANVKIMPVKVLGKDGGGDFQAIEKGIRKAMDSGVDVISLSLGAGLEYKDIGGKLEALQNTVIKDAIAKGIIVIVAAGNENCEIGGKCKGSGLFSKDFDEYTVVPCSYEDTICIGATDANETLASYSNYSSKKDAEYRTKADLNAPGTAIYSTWPGGGFKAISGTSMATPYVAGIAAIMKSVDSSLDQAKILDYLKRGQAKPSDIVDRSETGRVDLYATLVALANDLEVEGVEEEFTPEAKEVEAPSSGDGGGESPGSLLSAICQ